MTHEVKGKADRLQVMFQLLLLLLLLFELYSHYAESREGSLRVSMYHLNEYPPSFLQSLMLTEDLCYAV